MDPLLLASVGQNDIMMWSAIIDILTALKVGDFGNAANLLI